MRWHERAGTWPRANAAVHRAKGGPVRAGQRPTARLASFDADWLRQREPFDAAARARAADRLHIAARLASMRTDPAAPWRIIDLACGLGANLRWLAPRLGGAQQWLAVDNDAALLRRWGSGESARRMLHVRGAGFDAAVVRRRVDLARHLEALPWAAAHLVTGSALLDLVSLDWLQRLVAASAPYRVPLLFALSVDGRHHWTPSDAQDEAVGALFAAHQQRDKGFGPALGPRAAATLRRLLRQAGYRVHCERSDWLLQGQGDASALALQRALIDGMCAAACQQAPAAAAELRAWQQRRHALAARTCLRVGHVELLALPGA